MNNTITRDTKIFNVDNPSKSRAKTMGPQDNKPGSTMIKSSAQNRANILPNNQINKDYNSESES